MQPKPKTTRSVGIFFCIVIIFAFLTAIKIPLPEQNNRPFPSDVPNDIRGTYWLLLEGAGGVNLPGIHTRVASNTDPSWSRTEGMLVEPEYMYVWTWEKNGKIEHQVTAVPGKCYMIGSQNLEVTIKEKGPYWEYHVRNCSPFKRIDISF